MNLAGTVRLNKIGCCIIAGVIVILFCYLLPSSTNTTVEPSTSQINLRDLLLASIEAAEQGGRRVVAIRNDIKIESKGKTKEGANDSVTTADFQSHCAMMERLKTNFPALEVVSEESNTVCDDHQNAILQPEKPPPLNLEVDNEWVDLKLVKVWIDPLDATQEYTEKLYEYVTTMVCVAVQGKPLIGVIHKPFKKETSWAWVGQGRSSNLKQSQERPEDKVTFIVSRSHTGKAKDVIANMFKGKNMEVVTAGGAGYKVLEVVSGRADVYIHVTNIKKWDICAGNAILDALGGRMTTKYDRLINYANSEAPVNEEGLVATLKNHNLYLNNL